MDSDVGIPSIVDPRAPSGSKDKRTKHAAEAEEIGLLMTNRGNKLKVGAERITKRRRLWVAPSETESVAEHVKRLRGLDEEEYGHLLPEKDEPYCGISGNDIPIGERSGVGQVLRDPALQQTFENPYVERLAYATMDMIEREKLHYQRLDRLAGILQQDDPWYRDVELADEVLVTEVWERLQDHLCFSGATLRKLGAMRDRLMRACRDRGQLWSRMEELNEEQSIAALENMYPHAAYRSSMTDSNGYGYATTTTATTTTAALVDIDNVSASQVKVQRKKTAKATASSTAIHNTSNSANNTTGPTTKQR
ncbi:hypothetical protein BDF19DRAFT_151134 [Syncephalis fuscata]|nr:hypothetical protein BDF19DRAFT_151134 [Syncephalis fuscata]